MKIHPLKAWLPLLRLIAILAAIAFVIFAVYSIPARLEAQAKAEQQQIESHKAYIHANQNKDDYYAINRP